MKGSHGFARLTRDDATRKPSQVLRAGFSQQGWIYDEARQVILIGSNVAWTPQPEGTRLKVRFVPLSWQ